MTEVKISYGEIITLRDPSDKHTLQIRFNQQENQWRYRTSILGHFVDIPRNEDIKLSSNPK